MNAHQRWRRTRPQIAHREHYRLFNLGRPLTGKTKNTELAEARRKVSFSYFIKLQVGQPLL